MVPRLPEEAMLKIQNSATVTLSQIQPGEEASGRSPYAAIKRVVPTSVAPSKKKREQS